MNVVATIGFRDAESGGEAIVIVRAAPGAVGLALSLRGDGDIELFLPPAAARDLLDAIRQALTQATA